VSRIITFKTPEGRKALCEQKCSERPDGLKPGEMIVVPKGTIIHSCNPSRRQTTAGRSLNVKINHVVPDIWQAAYMLKDYQLEELGIDPWEIDPYYSLIRTHDAEVHWVGSGSYWTWCAASAVKRKERA
jgi:hypothetical protein